MSGDIPKIVEDLAGGQTCLPPRTDSFSEHTASTMASIRRESTLSGSGAKSLRRRSTLRALSKLTTFNQVGLRRLTQTKSNMDDTKPRVKYENTYKTAPDMGEMFTEYRIKHTALKVMEEELTNMSYDRTVCCQVACDLATKIKTRVKEMDLKRYKIVCKVLIGERKEQGMEFASRCIWDHKTDNYASVTYQNNSLFAVAMVFGVYFE